MPAINVRANRLAGTALNALGLPGAPQAPPLAVRKLQRARVGRLTATADTSPMPSCCLGYLQDSISSSVHR